MDYLKEVKRLWKDYPVGRVVFVVVLVSLFVKLFVIKDIPWASLILATGLFVFLIFKGMDKHKKDIKRLDGKSVGK